MTTQPNPAEFIYQLPGDIVQLLDACGVAHEDAQQAIRDAQPLAPYLERDRMRALALRLCAEATSAAVIAGRVIERARVRH